MSAIGSDDDIPDPLEHKMMGRCPWCSRPLFQEWDEYQDLAPEFGNRCSCRDWDTESTESENRTRYAEEVLDDAYTEGRIIGEQRKYGAGREV